MMNYILDKAGNPKQEPDLLVWAAWWGNRENRVIARTELPGGILVSTIFLGLDHSFGFSKVPILYETMIFGGPFDAREYLTRYATREEAIEGHKRAVKVALDNSPTPP